LAEPGKLLEVARTIVALERSGLTLGLACRLVPALVIVLALGLLAGLPAAGAVAAGGALTVGFGAFQRLTTSRAVPMLFAFAGIGASTFLGTLTGGSAPLTIALALLYGFWCGMLPAVSMGAFWIGQQCTIYFLIAGAFHGGIDQALARMALVLAGGMVQIAVFGAIVTAERGRAPHPLLHRMLAEGAVLIIGTRAVAALRFAPSFAVALAAAVSAERWLDLPNGYWAGMTALVLLRPDFHDTLARSAGRVIGTVAGALLASLLAHVIVPAPPALALLVVACAFCALATVRLNFGVFALFLTGYVVFLLVLAGVAEAQVALARVEATMLGAAIALITHFQIYLVNRSHAAPPRG